MLGGCLCAEARGGEGCWSSRWSYGVESGSHGDMPPHLLCAARMLFSNAASRESVVFSQCLVLRTHSRTTYKPALSRAERRGRCGEVRRRVGPALSTADSSGCSSKPFR